MHDIWQELANAIIIQAAKDYRKAILTLKAHPYHQPAIKAKAEIELFFCSGWCADLSGVDGKVVLQKLKREVGV